MTRSRFKRRTFTLVISVAAGLLATAGAARADGTVQCAQQSLRPDTPDILIVTCVAAEGDQRRGRSTVINGADQAVDVTELQALISFPEYGLTECGASRVEPGAQVVCTSPWVTARAAGSGTRAAAYSLVRVIEADGRYTAVVAHIHTTIESPA